MDLGTSSHIDAQFEKAVSIVQSLPKTGPIQTGYEDKLAMYSLYKQATVGNVKTPRPGMFDMLGRAKWDAWEKHKDLTPQEAKLQYVEKLLKVLQKYSDKTVARNLVQELQSFGDLGGSFAHVSRRRARSATSGSSGSASAAAASRTLHGDLNATYPDTSEEDATDDDAGDLTAEGGETSEDDRDQHRPLPGAVSQGDPSFRSPSSLSSQMRYRTPMAGSIFTPPPAVPVMQPLPAFHTPSAFGGTTSSPTMPSSSSSTFPAIESYPTSNTTYPAHLAHSSIGAISHSSVPQSSTPNAIPQRPHSMQPLYSNNNDPRAPLERAIEGVQAHIAALTERVEMLEALTRRKQNPDMSSSSFIPLSSSGSRSFPGTSGRPWHPTHMGLWSLVITPLTRIAKSLQTLALFIAYVPGEEQRLYPDQRRMPAASPVVLIVRRLFLDVSFVLSVLGLFRWVWRKTGLRRREVYTALGILWRALVGAEAPKMARTMIDRGV